MALAVNAMMQSAGISPSEVAHVDVPLFWPMAAVSQMAGQTLALYAKNLKFLAEEAKLHREKRPAPATANRVMLDLRTMLLRDYSATSATGMPVVVIAPYAGHSAVIADFHQNQSLVAALIAAGINRVFLTDWKSATVDMKDFEIDQYLAELNVCIDDLGGPVGLVGLCQGGWMAAMYAARFPNKVKSLVLAGAPIDTDAGNGPIKRMAHAYPVSFYEELVAVGGGLMRGAIMLRGWKNMHPEEHYFKSHIDLYEHIDDPAYVKKEEIFESWYENPIDLPGRWYLQVITRLFKENQLAKGAFVALGERLSLKEITCPTYLLAGEADDITTKEQVFDAGKYLGTPQNLIVKKLVPGGHIGLFMGSRNLRDVWPSIAAWLLLAGESSAGGDIAKAPTAS